LYSYRKEGERKERKKPAPAFRLNVKSALGLKRRKANPKKLFVNIQIIGRGGREEKRSVSCVRATSRPTRRHVSRKEEKGKKRNHFFPLFSFFSASTLNLSNEETNKEGGGGGE